MICSIKNKEHNFTLHMLQCCHLFAFSFLCTNAKTIIICAINQSKTFSVKTAAENVKKIFSVLLYNTVAHKITCNRPTVKLFDIFDRDNVEHLFPKSLHITGFLSLSQMWTKCMSKKAWVTSKHFFPTMVLDLLIVSCSVQIFYWNWRLLLFVWPCALFAHNTHSIRKMFQCFIKA